MGHIFQFIRSYFQVISFHPFSSLLPVQIEDGKHFQYLNIVSNNKSGPFFWNCNDAMTILVV